MSKILLSVFFFSFSLFTFAQTETFVGSVVEEETNYHMANAIVAIEGTALAQTTNNEGKFSFRDKIPVGEHIVTVTKEGYEVKFFIINIENGKKVIVDKVEISLTKDEEKRRKKLLKEQSKEEKKKEKEREEKIKEAQKELEKREKKLAKEKKKLKKSNKDVIISYDDATPAANTSTTPTVDPNIVTPLQVKYAGILGVTPEEITNIPLYEFIDEWMGIPYLMGGATKDGIDCSSFSQRLFTTVNGQYIERTAQKQFDSNYTDKFQGKEFLKEGDLLFFKGVGDYSNDISHVGVYLGNMKFVNATSRRGTSGVSGVKISDLSEPFWTSRFVSAGRRINNN
ncbi:NlpC/P60 family protein [Ulvibacter litoralis]|uniref:Lipoprotein Spr n=1 Tax=Ulvibacter litoralis TaxID=227084 RepID=A0A1G7HFA7_9FLAO|nr:NlpC/P60 family protein [Ulvibacter litoralis]GHC57580.1 hypothetical protein GCM10008083_22690 [Ulvibacter litoralis]SDE99016.1 lipoprotein Spr [Ulvibacter litoralis]